MNRILIGVCLSFALALFGCGSSGNGNDGGTIDDGGMDGGDAGLDAGDGGDGGMVDPNTKIQPAACRNSFNQAVSDFTIEVTVEPDGPIQADQTFTAEITPTINFSQAFLQGAADVLGALTVALEEVTVDTAQVEIGVSGGTTSGDVVLSELDDTPTVLGIPHEAGTLPTVITGPVVIELPTVMGSYTAGSAGETVFFCVQGTVPEMVQANDEPNQTYVEVMVSVFNVDFPCALGVADEQNPESDEDDIVVAGDPETDCIGFTIEP